MSTEEKRGELEKLKQQLSEADETDAFVGNVYSSTEDPTKEERIANYPGLTAGAYLGQKMVPPLGNPLLTFLGKGIAGAVGGLAGSEITGPYVKPYTDKIHDAFTDPRNKQVIALGDDFNQGQPLMGMPSVIDNSVVPYETVDSSSTGVLRHVPQL